MSDGSKASTSSSHSDQALNQGRKTVKSYGIAIDASKIHEVAYEEQPESLRDLGVNVFDQDVFEEGVLQQVDDAIAELEDAFEKQQLQKEIETIEKELRHTEHKLKQTGRNILSHEAKKLLVAEQERLTERKNNILQRLGVNNERQEQDLQDESNENSKTTDEKSSDENSAERLLGIGGHEETTTERLIRLGEMTPFGSVVDNESKIGNKEEDIHHEGVIEEETGNGKYPEDLLAVSGGLSSEEYSVLQGEVHGHIADVKDNDDQEMHVDYYGDDHYLDDESFDDKSISVLESDEEYVPDEEELKLSWKDDEFIPDNNIIPEEDLASKNEINKPKKHRKKTMKKSKQLKHSTKDDGNDHLYHTRIRETKLKKVLKERGVDYSGKSDEDEDSWDEEAEDEEFDNGLKIPGVIWQKLFRYQKTGVKWLWELHCQQAGGIVGDEMGLGKTIQLIAFLAGLKYSNISRRTSKQSGLGPVLIVCPATVIYQWVAEFHKWWPEFRVAVLHDTGSHQGSKESLVRKIRNTPGVLVTTYTGMRLNQEFLLPAKWDYVILDEGHIIRNPDAEITLTVKQLRTPHRIVLSGSPMQNNLRELWSLFDFVFPGKLGTLPVFMQEFSVPITMGGYANATSVQVQTAYKCACVLRDTINPYLLRRLKQDVKMKLDLPNKSEQVLFCRLTEEQTEMYKEYLASRDVGSILSGTMKVFPGLIMLRKICNHPDLSTEAGSLWKLRKDKEQGKTDEDDSEYGHWQRSGKLIVVHSLLKLWKRQKHKVLLFSQTRQMLKILEIFVKSQGYKYVSMDGSTSISSRQPLIEKFNKDKSIFVFLLTTRVGGLGVNLVGANRVVIYDPDWNPGTDMQAKERAWRVGQKRDVTIYRLLTTGTIEEKIYHRQIFKQFLTNRVLKDPKQRRFFKSNDLFELFTLDTSDNKNSNTETSAIFAGLGCEVQVPTKGTKRKTPEPVKNEAVVKMMKEKTKEILKTQFSSKESGTQNSKNNPSPNETDENRTSTNITSSSHCSRNSRNVPDCAGESTKTSDVVSTCTGNESQKDGGSTKSDIVDRGTGSSSETCKVKSIETFSNDFSEKKNSNDTLKSETQSELDGRISDNRIGKIKAKKKRKRNRIEGIRIGQLSHSETYVSKKDSQDDEQGGDDHYILRKLFKKSGVHSALQHETIVDAGNADNFLVENEAKRVASQAAEALKRSRDRCMLQHRSSGLPTWTGQSGFVGSPHGMPRKAIFGSNTKPETPATADTSSHFSGESLLKNKADTEPKTSADPIPSSQLLARMRARNFTGRNAGSVVPSGERNHEQTMAEVRNFIATGCSLPGRATTREILEEFSSKLPVGDTAVFRAMLKSICDFDRDASGEGYWVLKTEFLGTS